MPTPTIKFSQMILKCNYFHFSKSCFYISEYLMFDIQISKFFQNQPNIMEILRGKQ